MALLRSRDLNVSLDGFPILKRVSFEIEETAWVGLVGPNGSGKSTLLRAIAGMLPYQGVLTLGGREVREWKPRALARTVAFMQQTSRLVFDLSVEDLVLLGRSPHHGWLGDFDHHDRQLVIDALDRVDIGRLANRSILTLSGGELQRALLAQAFVQETDVLLLDEPTTHLDVHHQFEFMRLVSELETAGRTIIAVFHDLELAARYASKIIVLNEGGVAASGSPADVLTPALLAEVFRMEATVDFSSANPRISYTSPIARDTSSPRSE